MTLEKVLDTVEEFRIRDENTPVVLMGYANPIERMAWMFSLKKRLKRG